MNRGPQPREFRRTLCDCEIGADYQEARGDISGAIDIYKRLLGKMVAWKASPETNLTDAVAVSHAYSSLALLYRRARQFDLASDYEAWRFELWHGWDARVPNNPFIHRQLKAFETKAGTE